MAKAVALKLKRKSALDFIYIARSYNHANIILFLLKRKFQQVYGCNYSETKWKNL